MTIRSMIMIRCDHCGKKFPSESFTGHPDLHTVSEMCGVAHYCKAHGDWEKIHDKSNIFKLDEDFKNE